MLTHLVGWLCASPLQYLLLEIQCDRASLLSGALLASKRTISVHIGWHREAIAPDLPPPRYTGLRLYTLKILGMPEIYTQITPKIYYFLIGTKIQIPRKRRFRGILKAGSENRTRN